MRARLEKGGAMDVLRNQIIERKVIDLILEHAQFQRSALRDRKRADVDGPGPGGRRRRARRRSPRPSPAARQPAPGGRPETRAAQARMNDSTRTARHEQTTDLTIRSPHDRSPIASDTSYRDYQRQRQLTLGDLLLENRIILLQGEIHDGNANEVVMKLLYLQSENRRKDIHFYINSPGGSVSATLAIYDTMQILSCPVATYCVGLAASGGAVLLAGGTKGKRFALPHAKVMIHQPYGQVGGQVSDIEIQAQEILKTRDVLNQILAHHTGQPIERIAKDTDRDFYMTAEEAKDYGVVDDILTKQTAAGGRRRGDKPMP